ncbi:hypothetical protein [Desulfobulbus alkaliphilus]|uniref:hypothetical protein n=1 Tax=Desulfobulbus alkaliphilus TaxID=869814 RepID=UPI001966CC87|nr:hypothetical protein [Desulfobulbus alkaliphilus]MBM9537802.1 hypothetical protein [Desulfobulbus alkaliphilus]
MKRSMTAWLGLLLVLITGPATAGDNTAKFGTWSITSSTGEITIVDASRFRTNSWNFPADPEADGANWVRVYSRGELEYKLAFKGVEGSPHPDGLSHGGSGKGEGGVITGHDLREESGPDGYHSRVEKSIRGTYSEHELEAEWTVSSVITAGHITQTIEGSGSIRAVRGIGPRP